MLRSRNQAWQKRLYIIIFESATTAGKAFDIVLLILILASIGVVMADSVPSLQASYGPAFFILEWVFTLVFTIEYILRMICIKKPAAYAFSALGVIDLLAILPAYLSIVFAGAQSLLVLRGLRLLRVFRIFRLSEFIDEMRLLGYALWASSRKISVFMLFVFALVIILGSVMYLVENGENGFTTIPDSIYWAIVTITTVGYGDISPVTPMGKFVASIIMFLGYGIIAVPTGIVTTEMAMVHKGRKPRASQCPSCGKGGHDNDAVFCKFCGTKLPGQ